MLKFMMRFSKGARILLSIIFVNIFQEAEGQEKLIADFLEYLNIENPVYIRTDEFDQDWSVSNKTLTAFIKYTPNKDEEQVADYLQQLQVLGDLTMAVFIDNGHQTLLDLMINDLQLFKRGLSGLVSHDDVSTRLNLTFFF